eukprot:SAG11_NODE_19186_length_472_cov_1.096515_1_plen_89_part_10
MLLETCVPTCAGLEKLFWSAHWCPHGELWAICSFMPAWLLYPWFQPLIKHIDRTCGAAGLLCGMFVLWACVMSIVLTNFVQNGGEVAAL